MIKVHSFFSYHLLTVYFFFFIVLIIMLCDCFFFTMIFFFSIEDWRYKGLSICRLICFVEEGCRGQKGGNVFRPKINKKSNNLFPGIFIGRPDVQIFFFAQEQKGGNFFRPKKNPNKTYGKIRPFFPDPALDFGKTEKVPNKTYGFLGPLFPGSGFLADRIFFKSCPKNQIKKVSKISV